MGRATKDALVEHGTRARPSRVVDPPEAKPAQVGALLAADAELASLVADGVMAWLIDDAYERPRKEQRSGHTEVHKKKVHAAMSLRLACHELRAAMDERIGAWMRAYKKMLCALQYWQAQLRFPPPRGCHVEEEVLADPLHPLHSQRTELVQKLQDAQKSEWECQKRLAVHGGGHLHRHENEWYLLAGTTAATGTPCKTDNRIIINAELLGEDPCTFFSLAADQCQIQNGATYGLSVEGFSKQARNVTSSFRRGGEGNFSQLRGTDAKLHVVHSRAKSVDAVCCFPRQGFTAVSGGQCGANQILAQAMLHKAGVMPPYSDGEVCRATRCWGRYDEWRPGNREYRPCNASSSDSDHTGTVVSNDGGRTRCLPQCFWPDRLLLGRHPSLPAKTTSLQGALGLSDADMAACKREADRKLAQKVARDALLHERRVQEMMEDTSAAIAMDGRLPFDSIEELGEASPGIVATLRQDCGRYVINANERVAHALCIPAVVRTLEVLRGFFNEVLEQDTDGYGGASSGEAYAFVAGLHYGQYGPYSAHAVWCNSAYGTSYSRYPRHFLKFAESAPGQAPLYDPSTPICAALQFFDGLNCELRVLPQRRAAAQPQPQPQPQPQQWQWQISATMRGGRRETITFQCKWLSYEQLEQFCACAAALCAAVAPDAEPLPKLFTAHEQELFACAYTRYMVPKLGFKAGPIVEGSKAEGAVLDARDTVMRWYQSAFGVLAADPATRCAALDLVKMRSEQLVLERAKPGRYEARVLNGETPSPFAA